MPNIVLVLKNLYRQNPEEALTAFLPSRFDGSEGMRRAGERALSGPEPELRSFLQHSLSTDSLREMARRLGYQFRQNDEGQDYTRVPLDPIPQFHPDTGEPIQPRPAPGLVEHLRAMPEEDAVGALFRICPMAPVNSPLYTLNPNDVWRFLQDPDLAWNLETTPEAVERLDDVLTHWGEIYWDPVAFVDDLHVLGRARAAGILMAVYDLSRGRVSELLQDPDLLELEDFLRDSPDYALSHLSLLLDAVNEEAEEHPDPVDAPAVVNALRNMPRGDALSLLDDTLSSAGLLALRDAARAARGSDQRENRFLNDPNLAWFLSQYPDDLDRIADALRDREALRINSDTEPPANPLILAHDTAARLFPGSFDRASQIATALGLSQDRAEAVVNDCQHLIASRLAQEIEDRNPLPDPVSVWDHLEES